MANGTVKWLNDAKGFGFTEPEEGGADVFAHFSAVQMDGFRTLKQGSRVTYERVQGPKGDLAQNIRQVVTAAEIAAARKRPARGLQARAGRPPVARSLRTHRATPGTPTIELHRAQAGASFLALRQASPCVDPSQRLTTISAPGLPSITPHLSDLRHLHPQRLQRRPRRGGSHRHLRHGHSAGRGPGHGLNRTRAVTQMPACANAR